MKPKKPLLEKIKKAPKGSTVKSGNKKLLTHAKKNPKSSTAVSERIDAFKAARLVEKQMIQKHGVKQADIDVLKAILEERNCVLMPLFHDLNNKIPWWTTKDIIEASRRGRQAGFEESREQTLKILDRRKYVSTKKGK
ncbi:MAG: hypothetical protein KAJ24_04865 [Candidatus Aenigmarchaeota archaeon]|nr:hypothetical protein [Candidatus Aenigmarchaeota archaeon]